MSELTLPIFPLGNVVLFPDAAVPLHLFEPRYRQMMADALQGERRIGMATVRPDHVHEMAGDPPLYPIGCAGIIERHEELADGRYQLVLRGASRFEWVEEVPRPAERLYRIARVRLRGETEGDAEEATALRERVIEHLEAVAERLGEGARRSFDAAELRALSLRAFANGVAQSIALPPQEKQSLLEADSVEERLRRLEGALGFHLAAALHAAPDGAETVH